MKKIIFLIFLNILFLQLYSQVLKPGYYVSEDGMYYRNIEVSGNGNIKAGISVGYDEFKKTGNNLYKGIRTVENSGNVREASYNYYLEIVSDKQIKMYREGQPKITLNLKTNNAIVTEMSDCNLYTKYMKKMQDDPLNTQVWSLCAAAALQLCNAPSDETRKKLLAYYATSIKGMAPGNTCPCSDVIPVPAWNSATGTGSTNNSGFDKSLYTGSNTNQNKNTNTSVQGSSSSSDTYKKTLSLADENYYLGNYEKALELYKTALNTGGGSDKYLKEKINSLIQSGVKVSNSGSGKVLTEKSISEAEIKKIVAEQLKNTSKTGLPGSNQLKNADNLIDQYEKLLKEYVVAFKNSLSENEIDATVLLEKTNQLEELNKLLNPESSSFTESQLARIASITENFSNELIDFANSFGAEAVQEKSKYIRAKGVELPKSLFQVPGAYAVDPNPKQTNAGTYNPGLNSNTKSAEVSSELPGARKKKK